MQNRIEEIRKSKGYSAAKLADLVGTSQQQISRLEKSQRRLDMDWVKRISEALGCTPSDIVPELSGARTKEQQLSDVINETAQRFAEDAFISPLLQSLEAAVKEREKK